MGKDRFNFLRQVSWLIFQRFFVNRLYQNALAWLFPALYILICLCTVSISNILLPPSLSLSLFCIPVSENPRVSLKWISVRGNKMGFQPLEKAKPKHRKGLWSPEEDHKLRNYILKHGHGCWSSVPINAGWFLFCVCDLLYIRGILFPVLTVILLNEDILVLYICIKFFSQVELILIICSINSIGKKRWCIVNLNMFLILPLLKTIGFYPSLFLVWLSPCIFEIVIFSPIPKENDNFENYSFSEFQFLKLFFLLVLVISGTQT